MYNGESSRIFTHIHRREVETHMDQYCGSINSRNSIHYELVLLTEELGRETFDSNRLRMTLLFPMNTLSSRESFLSCLTITYPKKVKLHR